MLVTNTFLRHLLSAFALVLGLGACVSAPPSDFDPMGLETLEPTGLPHTAWRDGQKSWWHSLGDDRLDSLIEGGLRDNPSPKIAQARLDQAIQRVQVVKARYRPVIDLAGGRAEQRFRADDAVDTREDAGSLRLSWDLGLWGRRQLDIARAMHRQQESWFGHQSALLALSSSIAETYFQIVELRAQDRLLAEQLRVSKDLELLIEARFRYGQTRLSDVYQQRQQTTLIEQLRLATQTSLQLFETNLDILVGQQPDQQQRVARSELGVSLEAGLTDPSKVRLGLRPDIRLGYERLQQAAAGLGIRFAERLPTVTVTASLSTLATKTTSLSWLGQGANLLVPLYAGGGLRALNKEAYFAFEEERARYAQTWLAALEEVGSLRWQYQQQQEVLKTLSKRQGFARRALSAARVRYALGDQNYLDVLTAQRDFQVVQRLLLTEERQLVSLGLRLKVSIGQPMCAGDANCRTSWRRAS